MCGATTGGLSVAGIDITKEAVIQGRVLRGDPRSPAPTSGCSTPTASSPPRSRPRPPATSGSSPATALDAAHPGPGRQGRPPVVAARGTVAEVDVELELAVAAA